MMEIRPTEIKDLPLVMEIYDYARAFMRATGNTTQWFAGFLQDEEHPYAFVVLVENGGGGNAVAGTVAGKVLDIIVNGY